MKRLLLILIMLILLTGCGTNGVVPPIPPPPEPEEPPLGLIVEYTDRWSLDRWGDGTVLVRDEINKTEEIWEEINTIIGGTVVFKMTDENDAQIKVVALEMGFHDYDYDTDGLFFVGFSNYDDFEFNTCEVYMNPKVYESLGEDVYLRAVLMACGINEEKSKEGLSANMETVLYWLYKLEPGTYLW